MDTRSKRFRLHLYGLPKKDLDVFVSFFVESSESLLDFRIFHTTSHVLRQVNRIHPWGEV